MKVEFHDDKSFASAAALCAHYAAVRARLRPLPSRLVQKPEPPRIPLPVLEQRRDMAEDRRRDLIASAQNDVNEGHAIVKYCAAHFLISVEQLREKGKQTGAPLDARHVAAYVMRQWFGRGRRNYNNRYSLKWIGNRINRDHTCVLYADARVRKSNVLLAAAAAVLQQLENMRGPYVEIDHYTRIEPEAIEQNVISACRV